MDGYEMFRIADDAVYLTHEAADRIFQLSGDFFVLLSALLLVSWVILGVLLWLAFRGR